MSTSSDGGRSSRDAEDERTRRSSPLHLPARKAPAHFPVLVAGNRSTIAYLTVCTKDRRPLLANDEAAAAILRAWKAATHWAIGRYVILPDHIHLFCAPKIHSLESFKNWMAFWRNQVTRNWNDQKQLPLWQREFWDRQLRHADSYAGKWEYVRNNPVRHGYVQRAEDWPYQGELNPLEWHDA